LLSGRSPVPEANAQWQDQADVTIHWVFEPDSLTTTTAPAIPQAKNSAAAALYEGKGYLLGGRQVRAGNKADVHSYDAKNKQWLALAPMPEAQAGLAAAVLNGKLWALGGEFFQQGGGVFSKVWAYSFTEQRWQQLGVMPTPRHGLGAVVLDNSIFLVGGATEAGLKQTSAVLEQLMVQ
jgi:N-acetylneuraminic acid mutarotase